MAVKLSLSGSKGSSSSSLSSFRNGLSFQDLRHAVSEHSPCTTASTFSNAITTTTTITTPSSTIASSSESQTSPHVSPQLDATTLPPSASSPATTPAITSCFSSRPTTTAATTALVSARPSLLLPPPPEDVIKLLLSTTIYVYDSLTNLIDTNNTLRKSNSRIPGDQPICRADVLRDVLYTSRTATAVEGSSSISCPNRMTHDALHIVNSHRAFARAIKAEIAMLSAALAHFLPLSQSLRLRSFFPTLPASTRVCGLRMKVNKYKYTGGEKLTVWSDIEGVICMYDWLWTYSYSAGVKNWQEITWACAVVTGVYGAGGLEGVNARMRDYGIAHAGVVDGFYMADRAVEAERRQMQVERPGNQQDATIRGEVGREVVIRRRIANVDGKWVQVDPRVIVAEAKDEVVNRSQEEMGCVERRWRIKLQVPKGVVAVGLKIKVLRESIKGKEKCREYKGKAEETIEGDLCDEGYEKAMWR